MKIFQKAFLFTVAISLFSCQAMIYGTESSFDELKLGMSKDEVIEKIGKPISVSMDGDKGEEYLIYKKMKHTISAWPRTYTVTLRNGKVVKWGEQYEESNINNY